MIYNEIIIIIFLTICILTFFRSTLEIGSLIKHVLIKKLINHHFRCNTTYIKYHLAFNIAPISTIAYRKMCQVFMSFNNANELWGWQESMRKTCAFKRFRVTCGFTVTVPAYLQHTVLMQQTITKINIFYYLLPYFSSVSVSWIVV